MAKNFLYRDYAVRQMHMPFYIAGRFLQFRKTIKNWYAALPFFIGLSKSYAVRPRSGGEITLNSWNEFVSYWAGPKNQSELLRIKRLPIQIRRDEVRIEYRNNALRFFFNSEHFLRVIMLELNEQFVEGQYSWLKPRERVVVDIGGALADTAVYFVLNGARHVYVYEPDRKRNAIASKNISLNRMGDRVTLIKRACTGLEDVVESLSLKNQRVKPVLKIDCEGCEYGLILRAERETLRSFERIIVEYHHGYLNLKNKLERSGFRVRYTFPPYYNGVRSREDSYFGLVFAELLS